MVQLRCLCLALRWQCEITKIEIGALCIGATNQIVLLGIQKGERLRIRTVRIDTHGLQCFFLPSIVASIEFFSEHRANDKDTRQRAYTFYVL